MTLVDMVFMSVFVVGRIIKYKFYLLNPSQNLLSNTPTEGIRQVNVFVFAIVPHQPNSKAIANAVQYLKSRKRNLRFRSTSLLENTSGLGSMSSVRMLFSETRGIRNDNWRLR